MVKGKKLPFLDIACGDTIIKKNPKFLVSTGRTGYGVDVTSYHTSDFTRLVNILGNIYYQKLVSRNFMKVRS